MLARVGRFPQLEVLPLIGGFGAICFYCSDALQEPNQTYQSMQGNPIKKSELHQAKYTKIVSGPNFRTEKECSATKGPLTPASVSDVAEDDSDAAG